MIHLISSYIVQKRECSLPLLGKIRIHTLPAESDVINMEIAPPVDEILFDAGEDYLTDDLISYVSHYQNISKREAEEKINNWCLRSKARLDEGEEIQFYSLGSLLKNQSGHIFFQNNKSIQFYKTVSAKRAIHKNEEHVVLVGDLETTSAVMNEFYMDEPESENKPSGKIWTYILLGISLLFLIFYYYNRRFSVSGTGNHSSFPVHKPPTTYYIPGANH